MWKDIPGYEGLYQVSDCNEGVMSLGYKNTNKSKILKVDISNKGYGRVRLYNGKTNKSHSIHRLVATTFIPNPENLPIVLHLDNNPLNCHKDNLKWGTQSENIKQIYIDGRGNNHFQLNHPRNTLGKFGKDNHLSKAVIQYTKDMDYIISFGGISEAERETGVNNAHISGCCRGIRKSAGGFIWRYL